MTCPSVVRLVVPEGPAIARVTVPSGPIIARVATPGPPGEQGSPAPLKSVRIDSSTANVIYAGKAPSGSSESAAVWTITRALFTSAGVLVGSSSVSAATWTGRAGHIYP